MKLYEISENHRSLLVLADQDDFSEEVIADTLESIEGEFEDKAIALTSFFKGLEAEAKAIKEAENGMATRRWAIENKANRLREYLKLNMEVTGITKIECPYLKITLSEPRTPNKVVITNELKIPDEYMKITRTPMKTEIKKAGGCPGAELQTARTLTIR